MEERPLEIVLAASEALPYAKTGGLADVAGALTVRLAALGCRVHLFHPCYRSTVASFDSLESVVGPLEVGDGLPPGTVFRHTPAAGAAAWLLAQDELFDRPGIYGDDAGDYNDNDRRFGWFCRAVLAAMEHLDIQPDVVHCHDWQTALLPLYLSYRPDLAGRYDSVPTLMTIHNLAYQGLFPRDSLAALGIPENVYTMEGVEFYEQVNVLKGGIVSADALSTVSRRYSREIQTPEYGAGLEDVLRGRSASLHGILNGIDTDVWNPATDPYLPANYSAANLSGKAVCKKALLAAFALPHEEGTPLIATIARLVDQKGFDLIAEVLPDVLAAGAQYVLLGSGEGRYRELFTSLAAAHPGRMAVKIAYDEALSHRIEAGADFFLMPSRFEPCGLNQMYSLRYGTVPIVRATGGLDDTIDNYDPSTGRGNGLKFEDYTPEALSLKIHEALLIYRKKEHMGRLVANAMAGDFSWDRAATEYIALYRSLAAV